MTRRRALISALLLVLTASGLTLLASPASAATGSLSSTSGVLYSGCRDHRYSYTVDVPADAHSWSLDVTLLGPDGLESSYDFVDGDGGGTVTGTGTFLLCGYEQAGVYTMTADGSWYDFDYDEYSLTVPSATFRMRKPFTRTTLTASDVTPRYNQVVRFTIRSRDERPRGYFANQYARVLLQAKVNGRWVAVRDSRTSTNEFGKAVLRYRWNVRRDVRLRAVTVATSEYQGSRSRVLLMR